MNATLMLAMMEAFKVTSSAVLPPHHRLVMVAMADLADENGCTEESAVSIAKTTGQSRSTVEMMLAELCIAGWLGKEPKTIGKRKLATLHQVRTTGGPVVRDTMRHGVSTVAHATGRGVSDAPRGMPSGAANDHRAAVDAMPHGVSTAPHAPGGGGPDTPPDGVSSDLDPSGSGRSRSGSDLGGGSSLDRRARVAPPVPDPHPPTHGLAEQGASGSGEAAVGPAVDVAQDARLRATARRFLLPTDEAGWRIWEVLIRSEALREAEAADASVEDGSLARQANAISGKLMSSGAPLELATKAASDLAREQESARSAAGNRWSRPSMQNVSSILSRYFAANLRTRGVHPAPMSTRAPAPRVPTESGAYNEDAGRTATKQRLRAAAEGEG